MTVRSILIALLLTAGVSAATVALVQNERSGTAARLTPRLVEDALYVDGGVGDTALAAIRGAGPGTGIPPTWVHPPDGAIYPHSFPSPRLQWKDEYASRLYRVDVRAGGALLFSAVTREREIRVPEDLWSRARSAAVPIELTVTSGLLAGDTIAPDTGVSEPASIEIAPATDDPTGMILFGQKLRPADRPTGTVPLLNMHLRLDGLDLDAMRKAPGAAPVRKVMFRSSTGPEPTKYHPERAGDSGAGPDEPTQTQCVSCHAASGDGRYLAVFSQSAEEAPRRFDAPNGFMTILAMPERKVLHQLPHAFMPMFNPATPGLVVYGEVDETIGAKDQQMVRKSDLKVLDILTGTITPVPGASLPDRVENFPYWSPDGKLLTFIRTKKGEIWHGSQGLIDIAAVPWNDGQGGEPVDVPGASHNGRSNVLPVYSPDGRWIVFTQTEKGFFSQESADLMIVPSEGGEARRLDCSSTQADSWHRFSPDGRWLAVVTNREDIRRPHIYLSRFDSEKGTCTPAVQIPVVSGPGAHTHAFTWTPRFDWFDSFETASPDRP